MTSVLNLPVPVFDVRITLPKMTVRLSAPSKADYQRMLIPADAVSLAGELIEKYGTVSAPPFTRTAALLFIADYVTDLKEYFDKNMDIMKVPSTIDFGGSKKKTPAFPIYTYNERLVYEHTGLDFSEQNDIPVTEFMILLADAAKIRMLERSDGEEHLEQCYKDMHRISDF